MSNLGLIDQTYKKLVILTYLVPLSFTIYKECGSIHFKLLIFIFSVIGIFKSKTSIFVLQR